MSNKSKNTTVANYKTPDTTDGVVSMLGAIVAQNDVKHLEYLSEENTIRVVHYTDGEDLAEEDIGWDAALSGVEVMEEYFSPGAEGFQVVFDMMHLVTHRHTIPLQWIVGSEGKDLLEKWLDFEKRGMPSGNNHLMCIPLLELKSLPQETLILCGSKYSAARPEDISFAVKTAIDLRSEHDHGNDKDSEVIYRNGNGSTQRGTTASPLEAAPTELRIPRWGG